MDRCNIPNMGSGDPRPLSKYGYWVSITVSIVLAVSLLLLLFAFTPAHAASREQMDVVVLLDNSGSMAKNGHLPGNDERFMRVTAVQYLLEKMAPGDRIGLVTFDSVVHTDPAASHLRDVAGPGMPEAFTRGIRSIAAVPNDSTNMAAGFHAAESILQAGGGLHRRRFLLFLTDGTPNPLRGENTPAGLARLAAQIGHEGIVIHTIGLGQLSPNPAEAVAARTLLQDLARRGDGDMHMASRAEDLPPLFGSIFAQLAGHEISRTVLAGSQARFSLAPGTHNLRVLATSEGTVPELRLTDPAGKVYPARLLPSVLPGRQTAHIAVDAVNEPALGTWTAQATRGSLEVAWEPDFEAALLQPPSGQHAPSHTPISLVVVERQRGTVTDAVMARGRAMVLYESSPGLVPVSIALTEDPARPARFTGTIPDSGAIGPHHLTIQCYRFAPEGEEEGGPAFAVIQVARLPTLTLLAPPAGAAYALPGPVPVRAQVFLDGQPLTPAPSSIIVSARLSGAGGEPETALAPDRQGLFAGVITPGAAPGPATVTVTLLGQFQGTALTPQAVTQSVMLTPTPVVQVQWPAASALTADPDDTLRLSVEASSSAGTPQTVFLTCGGPAVVSLQPSALMVAPNQPLQPVPLRLNLHGVRPGTYILTVTPQIGASGVTLKSTPWRCSVHVRTWLERNRWWLYPALGLGILLALLTTALVILWLKEQARRQQKMLALLNGVAVYVPGTTHAYRAPPQKTLARSFYTFGGDGADVAIPDPNKPGEPLFREPRVRVAVDWDRRERKPILQVTPEGTETQFFERDGRLIGEPITPTEGGSSFRVEPEHILVRVNSEWTL